jgi:carnitine-CoA ligase
VSRDDAVLGTLLARAGERFGDRPYLSFALDERDVTFAEAADAAARVAGGLAGLGVAPGDRVLLMLRNRVEFVLGWLGAATLGAAQVPVNVDYRGAFLEHLAATAGARVLVVETDLLDAVEAALPRLPALETVVVVGDARPLAGVRVVPFAELLAADLRAPHAGRVSDAAAVHFTSGTSGVAKGAVVPNGAMHLLCTRNRELLGLGPDSVYLTELPLFHINAQMTVYGGLLTGGRARIERRFSATAWLERVRASGATHTSLLGVMLGFLLAQPEAPDDADNPLQVAWTVPYTTTASAAFRERFGLERVVTSYGSTELGMVARRRGPEDGEEGSAGRVDPEWYEVLVADESGAAVPTGRDDPRLPRSLVPHRRRRAPRRGRVALVRRPLRRADPPPGRERRLRRGRARAARAPRCGRRRGRRRPRRGPGRRGRDQGRPRGERGRGGDLGVVRRAPSVLRRAALRRVRRRAAEDTDGEGA